MNDGDSVDRGILLSQEEMDKILHEVRTEAIKQVEEVPSIDLSQSELDALFSHKSEANPAEEKKFERPKAISIVSARAKWKDDDIHKFNSGETIVLECGEDEPVEIIADGHLIAHGILSSKDGKKTVKIISKNEGE